MPLQGIVRASREIHTLWKDLEGQPELTGTVLRLDNL